MEAAQLRMEVEALRSRGDDLQQRLGVAEVQVRSLTSTVCGVCHGGRFLGGEWWRAESLPGGPKVAHPCVQG